MRQREDGQIAFQHVEAQPAEEMEVGVIGHSPLADPAEIAALERRIRAAEKMLAGRDSASSKPKGRKAK